LKRKAPGVPISLAHYKASVAYILEETAWDILSGSQKTTACLYAGSMTHTMKAIKAGGFSHLPKGMENVHFVRLSFHSNDNIPVRVK
jgi:hypothetical protein